MSIVRIISDTTCDLDRAYAEQLGITLVPVRVHFGNDVYKEQIDLNQESFWELIHSSMHHPTTSPPTTKDFMDVLEPLLDAKEDIIVITISEKTSGTFENAKTLQGFRNLKNFHVINSNTISLVQGILVKQAAIMAKQWKQIDEILDYLMKNKNQTRVIGVVDSLKFLHKGGRISRVKRYLGSMLGVKPLLSVVDGLVIPIGKRKGRKGAMEFLTSLIDKIIELDEVNTIAIGYTDNLEEGQFLYNYIKSKNTDKSILFMQLGSAIGAHTGPGTLQIAWIGPLKDEWIT